MKSLKNKDLILAYGELLEFDIHNLVYWKDKLYATKLQEEQSSQHDVSTNKKETLEARKRKRSVEFRDPFRWVDDGDDDDEGLFLTSNPEPIKGKNGEVNFMSQVVNRMSQAENDTLYEDSDCFSQSKVFRSKNNKQDLFGRCITKPTPSNRINSTVAETEYVPLSPINVRTNFTRRGSPKVSIYIGNPWEIVKVPLGLLDGSPFLQRELKHDSASGYQCRVMSPLLSKLTIGDFQPVTEFLACHEYHPRILDEGTPFACLQNITTNKGRRDEMMRCGTVYCVSHDLEMPTLGQLAIRKLKVLEPACRSVKEFLTVAGMIFRRSGGNDVGDDGAAVRAWLTNRLADRFWEFIMAETQTFVNVLKDNEELTKGVFGILSRDGEVKKEAGGVEKDDRQVRKEPGEGDDAVLDEKGKDEGFGDACRDRKLAWFRGIPHEI